MRKPFLFKRNKYYHLQYFDESEQRIKRISTGEGKKNDAINFLMEFQKNRINKPQLKFILLSEFSKEYFQFVQDNLSKKYLKDIKTTFKKLTESTGDIPLQKVTNRLIEQFISDVFKASKHQARKHYATLRSAFNKSITWDYLSANPITGIKSPKVPQNNPSFIDERELNQILSFVECNELKDIYVLAFHTGMRLGEIINLQWNQVQFDERIIRVINSEEFTTKGKKERVIPINNNLYSLLHNRLPKVIDIQGKDYVFNKNGFRFNGDYVSKKFKKAVRDAAKEFSISSKLHLHDLRHSFASNLAKNGVSLFIIKELLGHKDFKTTQIYAHLTIDSLRNAVKVLER